MCGALSARSTTRRGKFNPVMPTPPSNDNSLVARWQYFFLHPVLKHPANQNDLLDYIYAALADPQIKGILFDVRHGSTQKIETAALNRAYKVQMINIVFYGRPEGHRTRQGRWAEWRPAANRPAVSAHRGTDGRISSDAAGQTDRCARDTRFEYGTHLPLHGRSLVVLEKLVPTGVKFPISIGSEPWLAGEAVYPCLASSRLLNQGL
jgi:hypothetical protein